MQFKPAPRIFPDMAMWSAVESGYTYVISRDDGSGGVFAASAKRAGSLPFKSKRHDLGEFETFNEAATACKKFRDAPT